jgi:hypothetical protein
MAVKTHLQNKIQACMVICFTAVQGQPSRRIVGQSLPLISELLGWFGTHVDAHSQVAGTGL